MALSGLKQLQHSPESLWFDATDPKSPFLAMKASGDKSLSF